MYMKLHELKSLIREELEKHPLAASKKRVYRKQIDNALVMQDVIDHFLQTGESVQKIADKFGLPWSTTNKMISDYLKSKFKK